MTTAIDTADDRNYIKKIEPGVHQVHTEIDINTPAEHVYAVLTDFDQLREWSSTWVGNEGPFALGQICTALFMMMGRERRFEHEIKELIPGRRFAWSGKTGAGMADYHSFEMRPVTDSTCVLIQEDLARGGAAPALGKMVVKMDLKLYMAFNKEIKARAEATWDGAA